LQEIQCRIRRRRRLLYVLAHWSLQTKQKCIVWIEIKGKTETIFNMEALLGSLLVEITKRYTITNYAYGVDIKNRGLTKFSGI